MFGIDLPIYAWILLAALVLYVVYSLFSRNEVDLTNPGQTSVQDSEENKNDEEIIEELLNCDVDDLLAEAEGYNFDGRGADALVERALELKNDLTPNDWALIYEAIETEGSSKEIARTMAGDALSEEGPEVDSMPA